MLEGMSGKYVRHFHASDDCGKGEVEGPSLTLARPIPSSARRNEVPLTTLFDTPT
jgi:hypothetical protein